MHFVSGLGSKARRVNSGVRDKTMTSINVCVAYIERLVHNNTTHTKHHCMNKSMIDDAEMNNSCMSHLANFAWDFN